VVVHQALFSWLYFWLMLMLIYYERKILFHSWLISADKLKRTETKVRTAVEALSFCLVHFV
jgi:hypothetical protein